MLLTLHRYILRDMLRTFALSTVALTLVVSMGGGIANLLRAQGLSAFELTKLFLLFVPVAATFVLPVSAMFSAAIAYGRMSADNEVNACRAAGINIHRLFAAGLALGLLVAALTYYSWNYMIPRSFTAAKQLTRLDLARIAMGQLREHRVLAYQNTVLHADSVEAMAPDPENPNVTHLRLMSAVFIRMDRNNVTSYGSSRIADIFFDRSGERPRVSALLTDVVSYDASRARYVETEHQPLGPYIFPNPIRERLSFQDLPTLRRYARRPTEMRETAENLRGMRLAVMSARAYDDVATALTEGPGRRILRGRDEVTIELTADAVRRHPKYGDLEFSKPMVIERRGDHVIRYTAQSGTMIVKDDPDHAMKPLALKRFIEIELFDVEQSGPDADAETVRRSQVRLPPIVFPPDIVRLGEQLSDDELLEPSADAGLSPAIEEDRLGMIKKFRLDVAKVSGLIHFRSSLAASCVGMIVLAALMGVIFRGSHVLTAFGISCVPGFFVLMAILTGRNLAEYPNLSTIGLSLMWGTNILLIATAAWIGLKRLAR